HAPVATGVKDEARPQDATLPVLGSQRQARPFGIGGKILDQGFELHLRAGFTGTFDQALIEIIAWHLPGSPGPVAELVAKVDGGGFAAPGKSCAVFYLKTTGQRSVQQAAGFKMDHALREQALANRE